MTRLVYTKNGDFKLLNNIIHYGVFANASQIIIERSYNTETMCELRYRSYGELGQPIFLTDDQYGEVRDRIIKSTEFDTNNQGQFMFELADLTSVCRVELLDNEFSQKILIHLELANISLKSWPELGLANNIGDELLDRLASLKGLVILSGPLDGGINALAYSLMAQLDDNSLSIACLESPVLYRHSHYSQVNWQPGLGYSYQQAFERLALADNDIYFVDNFDALDYQFLKRLASAKLIIVKLVAIDLIETVVKLLATEASLLPFLKTIITSRNIALNCPRCSKPVSLGAEEITSLAQITGLETELIRSTVFTAATGCADCSWTGYQGQTVLLDILPCGPELSSALVQHGLTYQTLDLINNTLSLNVFESAWSKVIAGQVNPKEIIKYYDQRSN